jgi:hypothetical protein
MSKRVAQYSFAHIRMRGVHSRINTYKLFIESYVIHIFFFSWKAIVTKTTTKFNKTKPNPLTYAVGLPMFFSVVISNFYDIKT